MLLEASRPLDHVVKAWHHGALAFSFLVWRKLVKMKPPSHRLYLAKMDRRRVNTRYWYPLEGVQALGFTIQVS